MTLLAVILTSLATSFVGSMLSLIAWFHYDLQGFWEHRREQRILRVGAAKDRR